MGTVHGIYLWVNTLVRGSLDGETFWVTEVVDGFSWEGDVQVRWGRGNVRGSTTQSFSQETRVFKQSLLYVIYYILSSGGFTASCFQTITNDVPDPR